MLKCRQGSQRGTLRHGPSGVSEVCNADRSMLHVHTVPLPCTLQRGALLGSGRALLALRDSEAVAELGQLATDPGGAQ